MDKQMFENIKIGLNEMVEYENNIIDKLLEEKVLYKKFHKELERMQIDNAMRLKSIIKIIGWPTIAKVGKESSNAAWIILKHSISLPDFQQSTLKLLIEEYNKNNIDFKKIAYLEDIISYYKRTVQKYGTKFYLSHNGQYQPWKYDDIDLVNKRRKEIGLNTLEEETKIVNEKNIHNLNSQEIINLKKEEDIWRIKVGWDK